MKRHLLDFFYEQDKEEHWRHKLSTISDVLSAVCDESVARELIDRLIKCQPFDKTSSCGYISNILKGCLDPVIIKLLIQNANNTELSSNIRLQFVTALAESKGDIDLKIFTTLLIDSDYRIQQQALYGLRRFPFESVKSFVLNALHIPEAAAGKDDSDYRFVQAASFEILAQNHSLDILLDEAHAPKVMYFASLEVLFEYVSSQLYQPLVPFIEAMSRQTTNQTILERIAWVLADLGQTEKAVSIIEKLRQSTGTYSEDILKNAFRLLEELALKIVDEYVLKGSNPENTRSRSIRREYVDVLGKIPTVGAKARTYFKNARLI